LGLDAVLFALELVLGVGLIGITGAFVAGIVLFLPSREMSLRQKLQVSTVFLCVALATFGWLIFNTRLAKQQAIPVIAACKRFRAEHSHYPSDLNQLVPSLLPSLPAARYTLVARKFVYDADRPGLCFAAMFHGVFCYDFQSDRWLANE
jgi:hypothetical protein